MRKNKRFWLSLLLVIVLAGSGAYIYFGNTATAAEEGAEQEVQTAVVRQGEIVVSATGAGTIVPAGQIELSFAGSGVLAELLVQVGDEVTAGDVLARLDDTDAQKTLANARLQLAQAAMQTDATATATGISFDDISIAQAEMELAEAQEALDELRNWTPDEDEIAVAEAELEAAQAGYSAAVGQQSSSIYNVQIAEINLEQAQRDLAEAQEAYDTAYEPARDWELNDPRLGPQLEAERDAAARRLQQAQDSLAIAEANYNQAVAGSASGSPASAETGILNAELALEQAQNGPTEDDIAAAEAAVRQAELALQQAQLNREAHALSLAQAELDVAGAEAALAGTVLTAPSDGTVTAVNASAGETAGSSVIVLADLEEPLLEVFLDETDLDKVGVDYEVEVVFDAFPDDTFPGRVVQVDPQLVNESGVTAVRALVQLNYDKPQTLPIGLNATVDVIGGRAENALLVPVEALREISPGEYAVFVMENGEPVLRMVEVGLMDFSFAEILAGVEQGDVVTTGIVETQQ